MFWLLIIVIVSSLRLLLVDVGDSGWAQFKDGCVVVVAIDTFQPVFWNPRELHRKFLLGEGARLSSVALRAEVADRFQMTILGIVIIFEAVLALDALICRCSVVSPRDSSAAYVFSLLQHW